MNLLRENPKYLNWTIPCQNLDRSMNNKNMTKKKVESGDVICYCSFLKFDHQVKCFEIWAQLFKANDVVG